MPASEEDIADTKRNILKEMFGNMISSHVEGHKSKDSLQSIKQFSENRMTTEMDSKLSMEVIDNRQMYEINQDVAHIKDCFQIHTGKTDWGKKFIEDNSNRISEMGHQTENDINNLKKQKELPYSEVINTSHNRSINEKCSKNDDELTCVKEAYVYRDMSGVDVDCYENSTSCSIIYCQDEATVDDPKAYLAQPGFSFLQQRRSDNVQTDKKDRHPKLDTLKNGGDNEMKYLTDMMESEKYNSTDESSKDLDAAAVEEKQDVEKAEKCQEMAYAEHQYYIHMLYSEILSESILLPLSYPLISLPISSFLPTARSVFVEHQMYNTCSFESAALSEENRLSLEWPMRGNFCYQCNIVASRQTNIPSLFISDEIYPQSSTDLRKQREQIIFNADNKTCNLNIFLDSIDCNFFNISISQKCESKDVFEMKNWNCGKYQDLESLCNYQNILEKGLIDNEDEINMSCGSSTRKEVSSNFEELGDPEYLNKTDLEAEGVYDYGEDPEQNSSYSLEQVQEREHSLCDDVRESEHSFSQSEVVNMQTGSEFWKVEKIETVDSFDTLGGKTENNLAETKCQEKNSDYFQEDNEADFGELKDLEDMFGLSGMEDNNLGVTVVENDNKSSYSCNGEKKNKPQKLKKPAFRKNRKKQWAHCYGSEWGSIFLGRRWFFNNKVQAFDVKSSRRKDQEPAKCDVYQCRQENSFKKFYWKNKSFRPLFTIVKKTNARRQNDGYRKDIYKCKREFARKARNKMPKLFQYKIKQSQKQGTNIKDRNAGNYKWEKQSTNTRKFSGRLAQSFQQPLASMMWQHIWQMRLFKGCNLYPSGSPPIRLHLVKARVYTRSGAGKKTAGNYSSSGNGSTNGNQGNGNNSSQRGNGNDRHSGSGSGSGSGGSGNNNNNNNNNHNDRKERSVTQKNSTVGRKSKNKKADSQTDSEMKIDLTENQVPSPSLPPPRLDPSHVAERCIVERKRQFYDELAPEMVPGTALASNQQEECHDSPEGISDVQNSICEGEEDEEEAPSFHHAAISIEQLCDVIGISTRRYPSGSDTFSSLNICLTRIIHDLSLAADDNEGPSFDNCSVCLVLSQLLIHMADPGHDSSVRSCEQCSQIFNLIMEHCIGCITNGRQKSRITQSDLCYKICKYSQWNVDQLCQSSNKLKGKVQKYCDKVLGNTVDMIPDRSPKGAVPEGIGEIGETMIADVLSTGVSSTTTLSLTGNIVALETGEPYQGPTHTDPPCQFVNLPFVNTFGPAPMSSGAAAVGSTGTDPNSHMKLVRKPSHPRKTPAIPQPIPEDSQPESNTATSPDGGDEKIDDTERIIYRRMLGQIDPYETQKTYGNHHRYGSLQIGNVHDVEQFLSVSTQPLGAPGIGEVVFSSPAQLKIVAGFWDKKREECERTQTCPYQHREEGVILLEYKEHFGILLTRYQKHHQWERVSHLGNGMSGKCHLAIDLKTNFKFCCKKIHLLRYTEEELTLWSEMKNPYIVRLYGAIRHGVKIYIFSEFIDGGSLAACIEEQKYLGRRLSHWSAINYFQQLLKVLFFLQKKNILHEDIKADNILLRRNSTYLAVTDFGTSRRLQDPKELKNKSPVGSPTHWSPEKASMEGHGFPSDLWAAVCVLVHMLSGEPPWVKRFMHKAAILNFIIFARPPPMEDVPGNVQLIVRDLIEKGFVKDPQGRPSSSELLQHPAFKILDEGTPETYFSTLTSMAHGLPVIQAAAGGDEQQSIRKDVPMFNTADSTQAEAAILYEGKVSIGPYQESDNRPGYKQTSERIPEVISPNDNIDQQQSEGHRNDAQVVDPSEMDNSVDRDRGQAPSIETQNEKIENVPSGARSVATENQVSVVSSSVDSKVRQLVEPLDIDSFLPQFNELFMSGDSLSTQSIKSFFADAYSTEEFNGTRPPPLEMYKPEVKPEVIPNLSIFDWEALPATRQQDVMSESENFMSNLSQIDTLPGVGNLPIRSRLLGKEASSQYTTNFMLSSESDDCTSADLFEPAPAAKSSDSGQHTSDVDDIQAETSGSETQRPSMYPLEDMSHSSSPGSSSSTSTLQMRKPTNLTLHCTPLPPELSHRQSDIPLLSAPSANEIEVKHRSNTWSQLSSAHNPLHTGSTPSSSQVTSTLKKTNGTSVPSTASSGHSQFSYHRSSVKEEQEKRIQELTTDMLNAYSPTSSDSDTSFFIENPQQDTKYNDVPEHEDKPDRDTLLKTMIEEMGDTKLGGHNLKFFGDDNRHLFTMHIEELPANWRHFISSFRHKITQYGYKHFSVNHMNNKPVKYYHPLGSREFKVVHIQDPGEQCWCQSCKPMF